MAKNTNEIEFKGSLGINEALSPFQQEFQGAMVAKNIMFNKFGPWTTMEKRKGLSRLTEASIGEAISMIYHFTTSVSQYVHLMGADGQLFSLDLDTGSTHMIQSGFTKTRPASCFFGGFHFLAAPDQISTLSLITGSTDGWTHSGSGEVHDTIEMRETEATEWNNVVESSYSGASVEPVQCRIRKVSNEAENYAQDATFEFNITYEDLDEELEEDNARFNFLPSAANMGDKDHWGLNVDNYALRLDLLSYSTIAEGIGENVTAILAEGDVIWLGTTLGLYKSEDAGKTFNPVMGFSSAHGGNLGNFIHKIKRSMTGRLLLIGTSNGAYISEDDLATIGNSGKLFVGNVRDIDSSDDILDGDSKCYVAMATMSNITLYNEETNTYTSKSVSGINHLAVACDPANGVLAGTSFGVYRMEYTDFTDPEASLDLIQPAASVTSLCYQADYTNYYVGTTTNLRNNLGDSIFSVYGRINDIQRLGTDEFLVAAADGPISTTDSFETYYTDAAKSVNKVFPYELYTSIYGINECISVCIDGNNYYAACKGDTESLGVAVGRKDQQSYIPLYTAARGYLINRNNKGYSLLNIQDDIPEGTETVLSGTDPEYSMEMNRISIDMEHSHYEHEIGSFDITKFLGFAVLGFTAPTAKLSINGYYSEKTFKKLVYATDNTGYKRILGDQTNIPGNAEALIGYDGRLWAASGNELYFSGPNDPSNWLTDSSNFSIDDGEGDYIVGLATLGSFLFVFKRYSVHKISVTGSETIPYRRDSVYRTGPDGQRVGCVRRETIKNVILGQLEGEETSGNLEYIFFQSDNGLYAINEYSKPMPLDSRIRNTINNIPVNLVEDNFSCINPKRNQFIMFIPETDEQLVYGLRTKQWSKYDIPNITAASSITDGENTYILLANSNGFVYKFDYQTTDSLEDYKDQNDSGNYLPIEAEWKSMYNGYGEPQSYKTLFGGSIMGRSTDSDCPITIKAGTEEGVETTGTITGTDSEQDWYSKRFNLGVYGKYISIGFSNNVLEQSFSIYKWTSEIKNHGVS